MNKESAIDQINRLAKSRTPFLLVTDFECARNHVIPVDKIDTAEIMYDINGVRNVDLPANKINDIGLKKYPVSLQEYHRKYDQVHQQIARGNTYLLNLTQPTKIDIDIDLREVFFQSNARYKLWYKGQFVVFSPETFIQIKEGKMSSFPMKGTIDAEIDKAEETILSSAKEMAEHATIVDLIRNDMSQYATKVEVEQFRYIEEIRTSEKHLLQVSSKITGYLDKDYLAHLGNLIYSLLPAGSICGAPKQKTLELIEEIEGYDRGYYTGIVGYFDGKNFDSGVMIRFIEQSKNGHVYKSGGGIHFLSEPQAEYQEMIDKVYVPVH